MLGLSYLKPYQIFSYFFLLVCSALGSFKSFLKCKPCCTNPVELRSLFRLAVSSLKHSEKKRVLR